MLVIRLSRTGKVHEPHYRIVVQEKRSKLNGKSVDIIGHYHPAQTSKLLVVNKEKAEAWLKKGAQLSDTVTNLFVKQGILAEERKVHNFFTPKNKAELEAEKAAKEAEKAAEAVAKEEAAEAWAEKQEEIVKEHAESNQADKILEATGAVPEVTSEPEAKSGPKDKTEESAVKEEE
jgi:small subunit ribosomal protein S16